MTGIGPLSEVGESLRNAVLARAGRVSSRVHERRGLEADLLESDDAYRVVFDAPGATSSDLQVRYLDGSVLVRLDRFRTLHEGYEMRFPGRGLSLDGEVDLPEDAVVDAGAATATLTETGTLEVDLPKEGSSGGVETPGAPGEDELATDDEASGSDADGSGENGDADEEAGDDGDDAGETGADDGNATDE